jgi:Na+/melibiose symporter-like transporter
MSKKTKNKEKENKDKNLKIFNKVAGITLLIDGVVTILIAGLIYFTSYKFSTAIYLFLFDSVIEAPFVVVGIIIIKDNLKDIEKSTKRIIGMLVFIFCLMALFLFENRVPPVLHIFSFVVLVIVFIIMRQNTSQNNQ